MDRENNLTYSHGGGANREDCLDTYNGSQHTSSLDRCGTHLGFWLQQIGRPSYWPLFSLRGGSRHVSSSPGRRLA